MDLSSTINGQELSKLKSQVDAFNSRLTGKKEVSQELGKDDFMKILLTQLSNQNPTEPMKDKEFIAQMAQFSTLEQMTNLSTEFTKLSSMISAGQAMNLLGKTVDIVQDGSQVSGLVEAVSGGDFPQVLVNGTYYDYSQIQSVRR